MESWPALPRQASLTRRKAGPDANLLPINMHRFLLAGTIAAIALGPPAADSRTAGSRVDFGEMTGGDQRRVFLQVRANIIARLTIDSINRGLLKLAKDDAAENAIRYTATLNGTAIDLRQHFETRLNLPRTIAGSSLPFDLRLGDVGAHVAGTYTDLLTIEFSPL